MNKFKRYIRLMITSHSGISSKRICGVIGWLVVIAVILYCTFSNIQAPDMLEYFIYGCLGLLGIDSITGIWKKNINNGTQEENSL